MKAATALTNHDEPIRLRLPYPPTANNLFLNVGKRRVRTKRYDAWIEEATYLLNVERPGRISGAFELLILATRPDRRARDISNLIKPVEDLLVKCGVIDDDSHALQVTAGWLNVAPISGGSVTVEVRAA